MSTRPPVAVVVPASRCVCAQRRSLLAQLSSDDTLVVAWNGKTCPHDCQAATTRDSRCVWIDASSSLIGPGAARNAGADAVGAQLLAFTDADDEVQPNWLDRLVEPLRRGDADMTEGALLFQRDKRRAAVIVPAQEYWHHHGAFGGNLAITRRAWELLGGFDPLLMCCEDTDLAWRAADLGLRIQVVPSAVVRVWRRTRLGEARQRVRWGWWAVRLLDKHEVPSSKLPTLLQLLRHKRRSLFCRNWIVAGAAQWTGQSACRTRAARRSRA